MYKKSCSSRSFFNINYFFGIYSLIINMYYRIKSWWHGIERKTLRDVIGDLHHDDCLRTGPGFIYYIWFTSPDTMFTSHTNQIIDMQACVYPSRHCPGTVVIFLPFSLVSWFWHLEFIRKTSSICMCSSWSTWKKKGEYKIWQQLASPDSHSGLRDSEEHCLLRFGKVSRVACQALIINITS